MKPLKLSLIDFLLLLSIIFLFIGLILGFFCSGGSYGGGTCTIGFLNPVYATFLDLSLILGFTAIFWFPVYFIIYIVSIVQKVRIFYRDGIRGISKEVYGGIILLVITVLLIYEFTLTGL